MSTYLTDETILDLMNAIVESVLCTPETRDLLLQGIDPRYVASLPPKESPFSQIWSDLEEMNRISVLANGEVPLRDWLFKAQGILNAAGRMIELVTFEKVFAEVQEESERLIAAGVQPTVITGPDWKKQSKEYYQNILSEFLLPMQGVLRLTRKLFDMLRDDRKLAELEHHPSGLQQFFGSLPADDPRKDMWMKFIDLLQEQNRRGVTLIYQYYGKITLPEFRAKCDDYLFHAELWKTVWDALKYQTAIDPDLADSHKLNAPRFPEGFDEALNAEIAKVSLRAA